MRPTVDLGRQATQAETVECAQSSLE